MALFSPVLTLELHVTLMLPDWRDSQLYVSIVTVSATVGLILTVMDALLQLVAFALKQMVKSKVKGVSADTLGPFKVALAVLLLRIVMTGVAGEV